MLFWNRGLTLVVLVCNLVPDLYSVLGLRTGTLLKSTAFA